MTDVDCLLCGTCVADILVRPVPLARPIGGGRLFHVEPIDVTTGGIVCNTGIALARLGLRVAASGLVGADPWAATIRGRLEAEGIDATGLLEDPRRATSTTAVLIGPDGERSFAHHTGAPAAVDLAFIRAAVPRFARARMAVLGYVGLLPALEPALAEAVATIKGAGCRVAVETAGDGGSLAMVAPALPDMDVYVPSLDEAVHQTALHDPREIVGCYRGHGAAGLVGVKLGTRGALLSPAAGEFVEVACVPPPGPVADTTGAGDSFLAGLIAGLLRGQPVAAAGRLAAATAACCVTGLGATAGLRSYEETLALAEG